MNGNLLNSVAGYAQSYLDELENRGVAPSPMAIERLSRFDQPLPAGPEDPETVVRLLHEAGSPGTMGSAGGRFFGFVVGGTLPAALAAHWLSTAWDQNVCMRVLSPAGAAIEKTAARWVLELLGLPAEAHVSFVTGTTLATLTGLAAGRHAVLKRAGWEVEKDGLFNAPPVKVIVGAEAHATIFRALSLLGLGKDRVVTIPVDKQGRMRPAALPPLKGPTLICLQAGNVDTGAFDPAKEICALAHESDAWVHVDGAFGLWAAAAPERAYLLEGFNKADSWSTDGHKWLNVPYDCGIAIVRDRDALKNALSFRAAYLIQDKNGDSMDFTPDASQRARAVDVWAALRSLGRIGMADLIERTCRFAARFAEGLGRAGYEILNDVVINQVLVSFGEPERTRRITRAVQEEGTCWCSGTVWQDRVAMRISVSSWATTEQDVERSLNAILRIAALQPCKTKG
ncbi:MAG: aminotransferase class V-fold PLP-dependent enzyme [Planctomycetes bacterium]|nr:aminotransferase class V-fold PLP-dependent enzyme [Planctomycetota bacterium]